MCAEIKLIIENFKHISTYVHDCVMWAISIIIYIHLGRTHDGMQQIVRQFILVFPRKSKPWNIGWTVAYFLYYDCTYLGHEPL